MFAAVDGLAPIVVLDVHNTLTEPAANPTRQQVPAPALAGRVAPLGSVELGFGHQAPTVIRKHQPDWSVAVSADQNISSATSGGLAVDIGLAEEAHVMISDFVQQMGAAENGQDWDRLSQLFDDRVTIVHPGVGPVTGRTENIEVMKFILGAIDGYHRTTEGLVADGNLGAFTFTITGTHTGDLPGFPASGQPVEIAGAMFFELGAGVLLHANEILNHDSIRGTSLR
jgi:predicted ester cyclase